MIATAALTCLAMNIFFEARGETVIGQYAVAQVTMNRAKQDPAKICKVVYAKKQFSWTMEKKRNPWKVDYDGYVKALAIARAVLDKKIKLDFSGQAHYYHATYVNPYWTKAFIRTAKVGNHIFYRNKSA